MGEDFSILSRRRFLRLSLWAGGFLFMGGAGLLALRGWAPPMRGLRALTDREYRTLAALARALFPEGGAFPVGASDVDLARAFDAFLADEPEWNRTDLRRALFLLEIGPMVFEGRPRTFDRLSPEERLAHFERWSVAGLTRRQVATAFRRFLSLVFYDTPAVWPHIGYDGPLSGPGGTESGATGGAVVDLSATRPPARLDAEICVVGSGCGGATAAWDLARAGHDVIVLEEGGDLTGPALTQRDAGMYDQLYMDRGGRTTADLSVSVLQGRVLGGGGVVNACDVVPIPEGVLRHWQRSFGLAGWSPEALEPFQARALADLSASRPGWDDPLVNANNRLVRRGADALGWRGELMRHNRAGCAGIGACLVGCPVDAKRNPRFVAVPGAVRAGARFLLRARAVRIEGAGRELKTVHVRLLDGKGYREVGETSVRARVIILAANAVGSAQLLLRSGIGNEHVGRHLSLQPQLPVTAFFDEEVRFFRGIPQAFAVTEFERLDDERHGWWGYRIEAIAGTPGIVASLLPGLGSRGKTWMSRYGHVGAVLCLAPDEPRGRVEAERSGRLRIHYALDEEQRGRYRDAARNAARMFLAAGAREVLVPVVPPISIRSEADLARLDAMDLRPASAPLLSAHQQGGVRFAPSPRDGAADPDGQVYGTRDVYVFDSSGFPSSASSHTMAPIIAVAHRLAARLEARLGR